MGLFSDFLLTADYDRTLTGPDAKIPPRNLEAIAYFMENGGAFTVNTGRSVPMYRGLLDVIPVNAPLLLYNGSGAFDPKKERLEFCQPLELDPVETVREVLDRFPEISVEVQGVRFHWGFRRDPAWERLLTACGCPWRCAAPEEMERPFLKLSLMGRTVAPTVSELFEATEAQSAYFDRAEAWLRERFGNKAAVFRSGARIIDVHAKGVSKGKSARWLQARLGKKTLVCVGDGKNDLEMLEAADLAFCPADATIADRFPNVCPCAQGSVADVVQILADL